MFQPVSSKVRFPELEAEILRFWKEHDIFRKSIEQRPEDRLYIFYEGPPTANARPGVHHVLSRAFKDLFPRYKTMRGYRVPRKAGWDTHGLPVELEVERELGLKSKRDIEEFGVEEFNRRCRESVFRYVKEWEALTERIGFWLDMDKPYITYENYYIESCWWIIKQLWDEKLVYQDYRSAPHCPRCETSLSDAEVALGYAEDTPDPSIYVKFELTPESKRKLRLRADVPAYVLAWTTTPWTLPGNTALAVHPDAEYIVDTVTDRETGTKETLIYAYTYPPLPVASMISQKGDTRISGPIRGTELAGLRYEPLYEPESGWGCPARQFHRVRLEDIGTQSGYVDTVVIRDLPRNPDDWPTQVFRRIVAADFVSLTDGTGVVHIAPAFGGEDFELGRAEELLFLQPVDAHGRMIAEGTPFHGLFVKDADEPIMADLAQRGLLLQRDTIRHTYPFCWRCDTPLLYYAKPTWYIRMTAVKDSLLDGNARINWYPEHIRYGRFGDWLANNVDWALSRERYWGTPFPVWQCEGCSAHECVGSLAELRDMAVDPAEVDSLSDFHRPYIDRILLNCPRCNGIMRRLPDVLDAWFDSGAMPYAQWHYPFQNQETFRRSFPADFICEAVDQTRGWFYTLHAESTLLCAAGLLPESICYRNVICLGHIQDDKGRKMSKSLGNVVEPESVIDVQGSDALRWYLYTATPAGNARRFSAELVAESLRRFLLTLWNTYSFFVTYANIDRFDPKTEAKGEQSELDRWVLAELNALIEKVTRHLDDYNPTDAGRAIQAFVEDLSNWYVRRSRRRFWKSEDDADKLAAHQMLYTCLVTLCKLLAPFTPFVAETMYQNLVRSVDGEAPESVHLAEWPQADQPLVDRRLMEETRLAMRVVSLGRAARSKAGIKVRQPLSKAVAKPRYPGEKEGLERLAPQILEELNVKELVLADAESALAGLATAGDEAGYAVGLDTAITPELAAEGLARELVHRIQNLRKAAGFEISDRIVTYYGGWDKIREVLAKHGDYVRQETLSEALEEGTPPQGAYAEEQRLNRQRVTLAVRRVG